MPTYEYRCQSCGNQFEIVQSFKDASLTVCDRCSGELRKVYGNVGISFKGSGFYKNDARTGATGTSTSPSSSTEKSGTDSSSTTSTAASSDSGSTGSSHASSTAPASTPASSTPTK